MRGKEAVWENAAVQGGVGGLRADAPKKGWNALNSFAFHLWEQSLIGLSALEGPRP